MRIFAANLVLALIWAMVTGRFSGANLALGFALGFGVLRISSASQRSWRYHGKVLLAIRFAGFYLRQLLLSNLRVAFDVVTPRHRMRPGVVAIPLAARTDTEITLFANLITLTPGTLSLFVSPDRKTLYVHAMYIDQGDVQVFRRRLKEGLECRVLELLR